MKNIRDFKGVWIPKRIWLNTELTIMEKLFLVEIDSLDNSQGCYASNDHFADFFGISKTRCSTIIRELKNKGFVNIAYQYKKGTNSIEKRIVRCTKKTYFENGTGCVENGTGCVENGTGCVENGTGCVENFKESNTLSNTFSNTNKDNVEQSSSASFSQQCKEIIEYLNQQAGTSFQTRSKSTQTLIIARLKEGFTVENFKVVIYKKCLDWKNDTKMNQYLRPATLFAASKFEAYLNQPEKKMTTADVAANIDMGQLTDDFFADMN